MTVLQINLSFHYNWSQFLQCLDYEFGCDDGECIPLEVRCDGTSDCQNDDDEKNCTMILFNEELYNKASMPKGLNGEKQFITVTVEIFNVGPIDETQENFDLTFLLKLQW